MLDLYYYRNYSNLLRPLITKNSAHWAKIRDSSVVRGKFLLQICVLCFSAHLSMWAYKLQIIF